MPEKRAGQEVIRFYIPEELKPRFQRLCRFKGMTMTEYLVKMIQKELDENAEIVKTLAKLAGEDD